MIARVTNTATEFNMNQQPNKNDTKEQIRNTNDSFEEILATEIRLLDINYIRTMSILGGN